MRKLIILLKLYWIRVVIILVAIIALVASYYFVNYCVSNFFSIGRPYQRQMSAQMALLLPMFVIVHLVSLPIMLGMQYYFIQGGFANLFGKSKLNLAKADVKWDEVIGMESAKQEAWELVKLLKDRALVKAIGGKIIKGTLMFGPPGCGKTYLAKAIATECGLPIISAVGSEFIGMFIGVGTARMKSLFKEARALASLHGGCLIFIDEIDSFARHRQADRGFGGTMDRNATINQFLTEMDGLRKSENNIVVIGATNAGEHELDSAIMRAGRFDRKVYINRPNLKEREALFEYYLNKVQVDSEIDPKLLARKALWFSPADIEGVVREAGLIATRNNRTKIGNKDLSEAYDRVQYGLKSNIILSEDEKIWTAYHEAGHAVITFLHHPTDDVIKATIIPHKGALGFVAHRPLEEQHSNTRETLLADIKVSLGSYIAERRKFGYTSSGVGGAWGADFAKAMDTARRMVWNYGMGKSGLIGDFNNYFASGWDSSNGHISEKTKQTLDDDVQDILQTCLKDVDETLEQKWDLLEHFAQELVKKGELEYDEIEPIFKKFGILPDSRMLKQS